ncbi:hypothetical protein AGR9A_Lc20162 [Agrobacterium salinitolerans str. Hayward 0363]|nr:hypothetical protein AGR9A_Lc20162 [Agrobacterium salinitolerans str. Hayward 0363]
MELSNRIKQSRGIAPDMTSTRISLAD